MQNNHTDKATFRTLSTICKHWPSMPFFYALTMLPLIWVGSLCWVPQAFPEVSPEPEIETLDVIEVTGTTVTKVARTLSFPLPTFTPPWPTSTFHHLALPDLHIVNLPQHSIPRTLIDQTGKTRGRFIRVKPLKTKRPLYPRMAREHGWQGKVVIRARITAKGIIKQATVQESSGFPVLDENAVQAVKSWSFEPAKNGEFAVASIVDLPIRFDLLQ
jgi:TonB family protein